MNIESFRMYCLSLKGTEECMPFDNNTLVFKVMGKMYALAGIEQFTSINLKCDPEEALELRERYDSVIPGFHMNKKHWNTILMDGRLSDVLIKEWTLNSYNLVVKSLTKKMKTELDALD
jgi:predicted DNA-binding protein (MmcQ/YjbR family)